MARLRRRAVALLGVLLTLTLLLVLSLGYLSEQLQRYRGATQLRLQLQAQQLAEMGWNETRLKLLKDPLFPPPADPEQTSFTYSETVLDSSGQRQGYYHVTFDLSHADQEQLLICSIQGEVCPERLSLAQAALKVEWDLAQPARRPFRWLMVESSDR